MNFKNPKILTFITFLILVIGTTVLSQEAFNELSEIVIENKEVEKLIDKPREAGQSASVQGVIGEQGTVTKVVDGDTIYVNINEVQQTIRFIGIDTPETKDPRRPVGCFGKEASAATKELLDGKTVILQKDVSDRDKYDRLLRYVYLPLENGTLLFVNDYLVREGFAKVYTYPPDVKFNEQFLEAQRDAQANNRGLWGNCN